MLRLQSAIARWARWAVDFGDALVTSALSHRAGASTVAAFEVVATSFGTYLQSNQCERLN
jgi:hypothetical protein